MKTWRAFKAHPDSDPLQRAFQAIDAALPILDEIRREGVLVYSREDAEDTLARTRKMVADIEAVMQES